MEDDAEPDGVPHLTDDLPFEVKVHTWPCVRHLGSAAVRCMPYCQEDHPDAHGFNDFLKCIEPVLEPPARQEFVFFHFANLEPALLQEIFNELHLALQAKSPLLCLGRPSSADHPAGSPDIWVLCRFDNYRKVKLEDLSIHGIVPTCYRAAVSDLNPRQRPERMLEIFKAFSESLRICAGDLALVASEAEWTAETLESVVKGLSDIQLQRLHMDAQLADRAKRTSFQDALLRTYVGLIKLRNQEAANRDRSSMIRVGGALDPKLKIGDLINLDQQVHRLNEVTGETESVSLEFYIKTPALFLAYSLLIIGDDSTTGYGKSLASLVIGLYWTQRFVDTGLLRPERAYLLYQNTIDSMRDAQEFQHPYVPILIDEFRPDDREQNQHVSAETIKALGNISKPRDLRARQNQVRLHAMQPVIMTGNAESEQAWCGSRFIWSSPCARKTCVLKLTRPLVPDNVRQQGPGGAATAGMERLASMMAQD